MKWKVFLASATGKYHLDGNAPCQDAVHYALVDDAFVGVVCDGAGSAAEGQQGADFLARRITERIADCLRSGRNAQDALSHDRRTLLNIIGSARDELGAIARSRQLELTDYACTLVGCASTRAGGSFFHIGDGFAVHRRASGESVLSLPENGEYSDETYFVTDANWQEHLRVTPLSAINRGCLIGLMSDGTAPFAIDRGRTGFFPPFIDPIVRFLNDAGAHDGNQALQSVLESERTFAITADDKTLLLALAG
jgi:hypothetical protein